METKGKTQAGEQYVSANRWDVAKLESDGLVMIRPYVRKAGSNEIVPLPTWFQLNPSTVEELIDQLQQVQKLRRR